jgi:hypothetical protein
MLDYYSGAGASPHYRLSTSQSGKKFFQSNLTGTSVLLSGEFIILSNGQNETTPKREETITIPSGWQIFRMPGRRGLITIWKDEQVIVTSQQTTTNQFGFTLKQNSGNNYTASVKVLSDDDTSRITEQLNGNNTAFMNATMSTRENTWYKVAAKITEDEIITELYDENGTLLRNSVANKSAVSSSESGILTTYDKNAVIAFKNLKAETLDQPTPPADNNQTPADKSEPWTPYIGLAILLAVTVATIAYITERKKVALTQLTGS